MGPTIANAKQGDSYLSLGQHIQAILLIFLAFVGNKPPPPTLPFLPNNLPDFVRIALSCAAKSGSVYPEFSVFFQPKEVRMSANLAQAIANLPRQTVTKLRSRFPEVFGATTNANNMSWLIKRVAWRLQAVAEGGLSGFLPLQWVHGPFGRLSIPSRRSRHFVPQPFGR